MKLITSICGYKIKLLFYSRNYEARKSLIDCKKVSRSLRTNQSVGSRLVGIKRKMNRKNVKTNLSHNCQNKLEMKCQKMQATLLINEYECIFQSQKKGIQNFKV